MKGIMKTVAAWIFGDSVLTKEEKLSRLVASAALGETVREVKKFLEERERERLERDEKIREYIKKNLKDLHIVKFSYDGGEECYLGYYGDIQFENLKRSLEDFKKNYRDGNVKGSVMSELKTWNALFPDLKPSDIKNGLKALQDKVGKKEIDLSKIEITEEK